MNKCQMKGIMQPGFGDMLLNMGRICSSNGVKKGLGGSSVSIVSRIRLG
jgi:hypothetical protein